MMAAMAGCSVRDGGSESSAGRSEWDALSQDTAYTQHSSDEEYGDPNPSDPGNMDSGAEPEDIHPGADEELYNAVGEAILRYQNGEIAPDDRFHPLPGDFQFPDNWGSGSLAVSYREVMGDYRVVLVSADGKYDLFLIANNFSYVDGDGNTTGGNFIVTDVECMER